MEKFKVEIETGNAAFDDEPVTEIARILRKLADKIERDPPTGLYENVHDLNGNVVGTYKVFPGPRD